MTWELIATVTHKSFDKPMVHRFKYQGNDIDAILDQIDTQPQHIHNLRQYGRTAFKDVRGVKHSWKLSKLNDA